MQDRPKLKYFSMNSGQKVEKNATRARPRARARAGANPGTHPQARYELEPLKSQLLRVYSTPNNM